MCMKAITRAHAFKHSGKCPHTSDKNTYINTWIRFLPTTTQSQYHAGDEGFSGLFPPETLFVFWGFCLPAVAEIIKPARAQQQRHCLASPLISALCFTPLCVSVCVCVYECVFSVFWSLYRSFYNLGVIFTALDTILDMITFKPFQRQGSRDVGWRGCLVQHFIPD